jgi:catechol 2,3-dioxygenase-like lactoylglutathione lyase family enzyme
MQTSTVETFRCSEADARSKPCFGVASLMRRHTKTATLLLFLSSLLGSTQAQAPLVRGVEVIGITVSDMERSLHFYMEVLPFKKVSDSELTGSDYEHAEGVFGLRMRVVRLRLGNEFLELTEYLAPRGRTIPVDSVSNDLWFQHVAIIVRDMEAAYRILRQNNVQHASSGPQLLPQWNRNAAGIQAFYFKDPDGHNLEVLQFPPDKGNAKWHTATDQLFLGIDHTAIVVADTDRSLKFYHDLLGMSVVGESENYGTEQEHLNNVFGARLRITSLRSASGPGIELLEYLSPRTGRPYPADEHANDIVHWQTRMLIANTEATSKQVNAARVRFVSAGSVDTPEAQLGFHKCLMIRDPDGHAMQLVER